MIPSEERAPSGDEALARRAAAGDDRAFAVLAARYQDRVYRFALGTLDDEHLAEEVAQDVLVRLHRRLGQFRFEAALETWIFRVTVNACRDQLRWRRRDERHAELDDMAVARYPELRVDDATARIDEEERAARVRAAIGRLPAELSQVVLLRYAADVGYAEMSRVLGLPIGTISTRLRRALTLLGTALADSSLRPDSND